MKGTTKSLTVDAIVKNNILTAEFGFPRKDFGVGNDHYGDKLLAEEMLVPIVLRLE